MVQSVSCNWPTCDMTNEINCVKDQLGIFTQQKTPHELMLKTLHLCEDSVDNEQKKKSVKIKLKLNRRFSVISHLPQNRNRSSSWSLWFVQIRERNAPRLSPLHHLVIGQQTLWLIDHDSWLKHETTKKIRPLWREKRQRHLVVPQCRAVVRRSMRRFRCRKVLGTQLSVCFFCNFFFAGSRRTKARFSTKREGL